MGNLLHFFWPILVLGQPVARLAPLLFSFRKEMINYIQYSTGTRQQLFVILEIVIWNLYDIF
jgi:hypothetical protein